MSTEKPKEEMSAAKPANGSGSKLPNVTIINIVLLVGLLVLYALQFMPGRGEVTDTMPSETIREVGEISDILAEGAFHIAFVKSDSLMSNFALAQKLQSDLEAEQRRLENSLQRRQREFQEEVESFQRQIQLGLINQNNAQIREQELMLKQQELMQLNDTYSAELIRREADMFREVYNRITKVLEDYNKEHGYDYILGYSPGGGILYANPRHDVTLEILTRLNKQYEAGN